jgi:predicted small lipoprotein YifL
MTLRMLVVALIAALALSACGKKGPLDPPPPKEEKHKEQTPAQ